jgi:hypothetical protein
MRGRSAVALGLALGLLASALPARAQETVDDAFVRRMKDKLDRESAQVVEEIRRLLATPIAVEEPPSITFECLENPQELAANKWLKGYVDRAAAPELPLIRRLLDIKRSGQLVGLQNDVYTLELKLLQRLQAKANSLLGEPYIGRPAKILPVAAFSLEVVEVFQLLGTASGHSYDQAFLVKLGDFIAAALKEVKGELVQKHDFRRAVSLMRLAKWAQSLGSTHPAVESASADVEAAMTFDLSLTFDFTNTGANGSVEAYKLQSDFEVRSRYDEQLKKEFIGGSGTGRYVSYIDHDPGSKLSLVGAPSFPVRVRIDQFDACAGKATVGIDRFYANMETYTSRNADEPTELPTVMWGWRGLFEEQLQKGWFVFEVPLVNLKETPVETTVSKEMNAFAGKLTIKLTHTPRSGT